MAIRDLAMPFGAVAIFGITLKLEGAGNQFIGYAASDNDTRPAYIEVLAIQMGNAERVKLLMCYVGQTDLRHII